MILKPESKLTQVLPPSLPTRGSFLLCVTKNLLLKQQDAQSVSSSRGYPLPVYIQLCLDHLLGPEDGHHEKACIDLGDPAPPPVLTCISQND
jgi:hypothetical protein